MVDPGGGVGAEQLDDRLSDVVRVGRGAPLVADDAQRLASRPGPLGGVEDPAREVATRRPEEPGRPGDPQSTVTRGGFVRLGREPLPCRLGDRVRVAGLDRIVRLVATTRDRAPGEDLVGGDHDQIDATRRGRLGEDAGGRPVAPHRELGVERAAVDVRPGRRMDDDLGPLAVQQLADPVRGVKVEGVPGPGERTGRARERGVGERRDDRAAEPTAGTGDGDPHPQSAVDGAASASSGSASWPPARRCAYWRWYQ